jgi:hypothetical protein
MLSNDFGILRARPDKSHLTANNVEELWKLIELRRAQQCSEWKDTRIAASRN